MGVAAFKEGVFPVFLSAWLLTAKSVSMKLNVRDSLLQAVAPLE
jgi:hypothetical protein